MAQSVRRRKKDDANEKFFLYIAFHSALTAVANLFKDD